MAAVPKELPSTVTRGAYAAVLPLLVAPLVVATSPHFTWQVWALRGAVAYGAVLLAWSGAVHFGLCVAGRLACSPMVVIGAVAPSVLAMLAVLLGGQRGLGLLVIGSGTFWLYESRRLARDLPTDYLSLRRNLSVAVCALLAITMFAAESAGLR